RRGDGGLDGGERRRADALRHGQSGGPGRPHRRHPGVAQRGRQDRELESVLRSGRVVIASTRAASGVYEDRTGPVIVDWLNQRGITTPAPSVVADGIGVNRALFDAVGESVDVIITSGGTGISPTDGTAEATANIVD